MKLVLIIIVITTALVLGPIALIWSLNTLFHLGIPYSFSTWAAALLLAGAVSSSNMGGK